MTAPAVKIPTFLMQPNLPRYIIGLFGVVAAAAMLAGCTSELTRVDLSRIGAPPPGDAVIFIIRPSYLSYGSRDLTIRVNDIEIADLPRLSYTSFLMPAGNMKLSGEGGWYSWPQRELNIDVKDGRQYYLVWTLKETASSALMLYLFPTLTDLRWESVSKEDAQKLLDGIYHVEPTFQEVPR